ncbi:hypothetical protein LR68_04373 [Anoxybacillus sp. BCO1]|nr:hypothetical protein LR68_04373 [Anoxybacillus sp. BCO1]
MKTLAIDLSDNFSKFEAFLQKLNAEQKQNQKLISKHDVKREKESAKVATLLCLH